MTNAVQRQVFKHIVSIDSLSMSLEKLMIKIWSIKGGYRRKTLLPTLIGLEVVLKDRIHEVPTMRKFLKGLRGTQDKHFIRFVSTMIWAMESDNGDLFYTPDNASEEMCDIIWRIEVINSQYVVVVVDIPKTSHQNILFHSLCQSLTPSVGGPVPDPSDEDTFDFLMRFYRTTDQLPSVRNLSTSFHVLLIPNREGNSLYPIPLVGISVSDAKRKYAAAIKALTVAHRQHSEFFMQSVTVSDVLSLLIESIQDNEFKGIRRKTSQCTYALAELLFSCCVVNDEDPEGQTNHDLLLFEKLDDDVNSVNLHRFSVEQVEED